MDLKVLCEELDDLAVKYFQILEELSEQRRRFEKFVREGFFNLSKARYSMGNQAVGSLQYDTNAMTALAHVVTSDEGDCHSFEVVRTKALNRSQRKSVEGSEPGTNPQIPDTDIDKAVTRRRRPVSTPPSEGVETLTADMEELSTSENDVKQRIATDPLLWFGVLVPQTLRHGQNNFIEAVDACTLMASLQTRLDKAYAMYRSKLQEKYNMTNQSKSNGEQGEATSTGAISTEESS